jgi:asparagine synthase (glutamine-hydrolysing)
MIINTKFKGADQILSKVNCITSALGLEARSPLFDRRVVEASLSTPPQFKLMGAQEKAVLKAAMEDLLPTAIINRPKSGMMVPVQHWFRNYWQSKAKRLLLSRNAIKEWLAYRGDLWGRYGVKLWLLCSLELWMQVNDAE